MKDLTDTNIYYINLDIRKDRRTQFEALPALEFMPPVERIPAVHGLSFRNFSEDKRIGLHTRVQVITEYRRSHYEIHSRGAVGASFSHLKTWKKFLESDAQYALIMEDDAELPTTFCMMVRDCAKELPSDWDIWILGWNHIPIDYKDSGNGPFHNVLHFTGAHAYILTRKAAMMLIDEALPVETHVEHFMNNVAFIHKFHIVRNVNLHVPQMDRILNISDVRKPKGCLACKVDDKDVDIASRNEKRDLKN
jgi:GR25 family glycosyltransferase involved in LPS biosynthesis